MLQLAEILPGGSSLSFSNSHISGQVICVILGFGSIFAWSILVTKLIDLNRAIKESGRFLIAYRNEPHPLSLFVKRKKYSSSPLHGIYHRTCQTVATALEATGIEESDLFMGGVSSENRRLDERQVGNALNVAERTMADMALLLEDNMVFLATAASAAPFLGLLGTVWGVMIAFGNIRASGSAMLPEVAPGIAGALLTTVVGLVVALPSSIGYNWATSKIRTLRVRMDNFVREFIADIELHFLETIDRSHDQ